VCACIKVAAWYPFFADMEDRSENNLHLLLRTQPPIDGRSPADSVALIHDDLGPCLSMTGSLFVCV